MKKYRILTILMVVLMFVNGFVFAEESSGSAKEAVKESERADAAGEETEEGESSTAGNVAVSELKPGEILLDEAKVKFTLPESLGLPQTVSMNGTTSSFVKKDGDYTYELSTSLTNWSESTYNMNELSGAELETALDEAMEGFEQTQFMVKTGEVITVNGQPFLRFEGLYQGNSLVSYQTVVNGYFVVLKVQDLIAKDGVVRKAMIETNEEILSSMEVVEELPRKEVVNPVSGSSLLIFLVIIGIIVLVGISYYLSERKSKQKKEEAKSGK